jgi:2-succinyl-6-hydroxy-2,4-cyclohexadiene-1-carboxylate synthase
VQETVVMLHGFGGTARHWDRVIALTDRERYSPLPLDLTDAEPLAIAGVVDLVARRAPERFILCGYSMGGRVALHVVSGLAGRVSRLVLVSASAGISSEEARLTRASSDKTLAKEIERGSIEDFIARWRQTPLFSDDPEWVQEAVAKDTRRVTPAQLAATLRAFGAGTLDSKWDGLGLLNVPTVVLVGERDVAYCEIGRRLAGAIPLARFELVSGVRHRVALEAPQAVVDAFAHT